ncbi:M23 family metallopeptidase [Streptomyces sp. ME01-24h]|nr:M23 family metallopeptidase [Streptomyces sp. ME19-03-3]MDX3352264.1 M23 family metallopeptidase [Streptomyces sp. ME01-24h]
MASFSIRSTLACAAALTTATTGAFVGSAAAADNGTRGSAFARCAAVAGDLATELAEQASAQQQAAADAQRHEAQVAREKRAARERAAKEARAKAAREGGTARASRSAAAGRGTLGGWVLPVAGAIGTPYHATSSLWSSGYHTGVDFVAPVGTPVHAVGAGTVVEAGWGGSYGYNIVIRHADGMYTQYGHMSSLGVSVGQTVSAGRQIGLSGATGNVTGPHLHFEARTAPSYGADVNPLAYLRSKGVRI